MTWSARANTQRPSGYAIAVRAIRTTYSTTGSKSVRVPIASWRSHRLPSPFAAWFPSDPDRPAPPLWKQGMLVLLVLYPIVMLELRFLNPLLAPLMPAPATFIGNAISVALVTWPLMPVTVFCLGWWLQPAPQRRLRTTLFGLALIALLYAAEVLVLWKLL